MKETLLGYISEAQVVFEELLIEYGLMMFISAQLVSGLGLLFFIPDGAVTPTFVLIFADNIFHVFLIATLSAAALVTGNFFLYLFFRLLGERVISEEKRETTFWRFMEWTVKKNAKISLIVLRLLPIGGGLAAIPAGLVKVKARTFLFYSFIGFLIYELTLGLGTWYVMEGELVIPAIDLTELISPDQFEGNYTVEPRF